MVLSGETHLLFPQEQFLTHFAKSCALLEIVQVVQFLGTNSSMEADTR